MKFYCLSKCFLFIFFAAELTSRGVHVQSPRFSPDGEKLVFLKSPMGGTHIQSAQLCLMNFENKEVSSLVTSIQ